MEKTNKFRALLDAAIKEAQYEVLTKAEDKLCDRSNALFNILVSEEGRNIWTMSSLEVFWKISAKREEVRAKSNAYCEAAFLISKMKREL